jgi:hypothetical protein
MEPTERPSFLSWQTNSVEFEPLHPSCTVNTHYANHSLLADLTCIWDGILHCNLLKTWHTIYEYITLRFTEVRRKLLQTFYNKETCQNHSFSVNSNSDCNSLAKASITIAIHVRFETVVTRTIQHNGRST